MNLTAEILTNICPAIKGRAQYVADTLNAICPAYGMDSADILEDFIPNLLVECQEFTQFEENLNYSAQALIDKFSAHGRISVEDAKKYGRTPEHKANQEAIANCIYGGEWGKINLGNVEPDDGYTFRGSGAVQGTGRKIITDFTEYYNAKFGTNFSVYQMVVAMRDKSHIEIGIHFACWFFSVAKKLIPLSLSDNFKELVHRINGGYTALNERSAYKERSSKFLA